MLESGKGVSIGGIPNECSVFLSEVGKGCYNSTVASDEVLVEVCKTEEGLYVFDVHWGLQFLDGGDLHGVYLISIPRNNEA
jgi:hypothetical protein